MLQNKETTAQSYRKMSNQNTRSPGPKFTLFNCMGRMEIDNFSCFNNSLVVFLFYNELAGKKFMAHIRLQLNLPPPPIRASTLLPRPPNPPPPLSERTYFMGDPFSY